MVKNSLVCTGHTVIAGVVVQDSSKSRGIRSAQLWLLSIFLAFLTVATNAATVCVGPAATGNGSGADWANLKAWSSTPARGDIWYLVTGTYPGKTFSVAASGTTLITIKKATAEDHGGISTGWVSSTMGDGQAQFTGQIWFSTSYWVFDGVKHGANIWSTTATDYGFYFSGQTRCFSVYNTASAMSDVTIANVAGIAASGDVEKFFCGTHNQTKSVSRVTISHCLVNGWQNAYWATSAGFAMDTWIFEYNVCINGTGSSANHGEWINNNYGLMQNQITRYNLFKGPGSGYTGVIVANNNDNVNPQIYGNVFDSYSSGNGVITGTSGGTISGAKVYNNVFLNCGVGWLGNTASPGSVAYNNIVYNMSAGMTSGYTGDYNAYFSCSSTPSEAHGQTGTGNPFNNSAGSDYTLKANTTSGTVLPSPYDIDPTGKARATWTRGAFEFGTVITNAMISVTPSSLSFGSVVTNTTSDQTITVRNIGTATLSGVASVAAPFTIVSGGTYSLSANQSQAVTIRFSPTSVTSYSQNVTFTGGGGATVTIGAAGILASANTPPTVSAVAQNAADVDPNTSGIQVYEGTVVQYSGSASDANGNALTWQWIYTVNGGAEVVYQSGTGAVTPASFSYGAGTAGRTYLWKLRVSDGVATAESQLSVGISAPPVVGTGISYEAEAGAITAPFTSAGGSISQSTTTDLAGGGRAVYTFSVTNAGEYAIQAYVNAPGLTENSFYLNIDAEPQDPAMAWDILPPTVGFENRLISWRGNGTADANELVPKFFNLSQGTHQLIIIGREANVQLDRFVIFKRPSAPGNLRSLASVGQ